MLEGLLHLFEPRPWHEVVVDVLDVGLVAYLIYRMLLVMRGTRAIQISAGLALIVLVYFGSRWAGLITLNNLLSYLLSSLILVVVVVFQSDIRRALMRVGSRAVFSGGSHHQETMLVEEVVAAATELARHRIGALICFEQEANLDEFATGAGTRIDALVQRDLLVSMFIPEGLNKLHDGAVLIRNLRVAQAGVFFPMPETKGVDRSLGTRHRAAIGVSDETDAVVVVVSEERGTISVCFDGNIIPNLDGTTLRQALLGLLGESKKKRKKNAGKTPSAGARGVAASSEKVPRVDKPASRGPAAAKARPELVAARIDTLRSLEPQRVAERLGGDKSDAAKRVDKTPAPEPAKRDDKSQAPAAREGAAAPAKRDERAAEVVLTPARPLRVDVSPRAAGKVSATDAPRLTEKTRPPPAEPETRPMQSSMSTHSLGDHEEDSGDV